MAAISIYICGSYVTQFALTDPNPLQSTHTIAVGCGNVDALPLITRGYVNFVSILAYYSYSDRWRASSRLLCPRLSAGAREPVGVS